MGKIRVKTFGDEELEHKEKEELKKRKEAKINAAKSASKQKQEDSTKQNLEDTIPEKTQAKETEETLLSQETHQQEEKPTENKKTTGVTKPTKSLSHSQKYQALLDLFDKKKTYTLSEGLDVLSKMQRDNFDETAELHINTVSAGISGNVVLPHGTGKKTKVAIATEELIESIEKGKVDFDILVAEPTMMVKLAKVARILGPRGLMPNPKNGTITSNPTEAAKKYENGQINFKTEAKTPIIHLNVGKMSFGKEKLTQNIETMLTAVKKSNVVNITLKSTMSPGIKIKV